MLGKNRPDMFGELLQAANSTGDLRSCPVCYFRNVISHADHVLKERWQKVDQFAEKLIGEICSFSAVGDIPE